MLSCSVLGLVGPFLLAKRTSKDKCRLENADLESGLKTKVKTN